MTRFIGKRARMLGQRLSYIRTHRNVNVLVYSSKMVSDHGDLSSIETHDLRSFKRSGVLIKGVTSFIDLDLSSRQDHIVKTMNGSKQTGGA
jgi:hypothetical protein